VQGDAFGGNRKLGGERGLMIVLISLMKVAEPSGGEYVAQNEISRQLTPSKQTKARKRERVSSQRRSAADGKQTRRTG